MTDTGSNNGAAQPDPHAERIRRLVARAEKAGYVLVRSAAPRHEWKLMDGDYGEDIVTATDLNRIEQWLDT